MTGLQEKQAGGIKMEILFLKKYNIFCAFGKKDLQTAFFSYILAIAVALIAVKREVAAYVAGFPWSECQVRKLTTSHCTNVKCLSRDRNDV